MSIDKEYELFTTGLMGMGFINDNPMRYSYFASGGVSLLMDVYIQDRAIKVDTWIGDQYYGNVETFFLPPDLSLMQSVLDSFNENCVYHPERMDLFLAYVYSLN